MAIEKSNRNRGDP